MIDGKSGSVAISAEKEISLKTGSAELLMESGGDITLEGTKLLLKGNSGVKAQSGGTLELKGQKTELSGAMVELKSSGVMTVKGSITQIN